MRLILTSGVRYVILLCFFLTACYILALYDANDAQQIRAVSSQVNVGGSENNHRNLPYVSRRDLSHEECKQNFPKQYADSQYSIGRGKIFLEEEDGDYQGLVQGKIEDSKLYIISTAADAVPQIIHQRTAVLSQIHRALTTSPTRLPDTYFAFVVNDVPKNNSWTFARPNKHSIYKLWLMPSFALWSWPTAAIGAFDDVLQRINKIERRVPWERKIDKIVWRGTSWFNPLGHPALRKDLLREAQGKEWADIASLNKSSTDENNALRIEDFCKYKYIVYTEGVTYSGRLPYHQACRSVLITPPLTFLTHTAWLMKPITTAELFATFRFPFSSNASSPGTFENGLHPLLKTVNDWRKANSIYVSPTFADLEDLIMFLRRYPEVALRIAQNQRQDVIEAGYLSNAAEVCYWRAMIGAWAKNLEVHGDWKTKVGERYETWLLRQITEGKTRLHQKSKMESS